MGFTISFGGILGALIVYFVTGFFEFTQPYQIPLTILMVASMFDVRTYNLSIEINDKKMSAQSLNMVFWITLFILVIAFPFPFVEYKWRIVELIVLLICFIILSYKRYKEKQKVLKLMTCYDITSSIRDYLNNLILEQKENENPEAVDSQDSKTLEK